MLSEKSPGSNHNRRSLTSILRRSAQLATHLRELIGPVEGEDPSDSQPVANGSVDPSLSGLAIDQFIRFDCQRRAPRHTHVGRLNLGRFDLDRFKMSVSYASPLDGSF